MGAEALEGVGKGRSESVCGRTQGPGHWVLHPSAPPAPRRIESTTHPKKHKRLEQLSSLSFCSHPEIRRNHLGFCHGDGRAG